MGRARKEDHVAYSEIAIRNNGSIIEYCRTSMAALSGSTAGLLGLTALWGFIFYFGTAFLLWVMLLAKAGSKWKKYFPTRRALLTNGLLGGLFTYVLFWTNYVAYGQVIKTKTVSADAMATLYMEWCTFTKKPKKYTRKARE